MDNWTLRVEIFLEGGAREESSSSGPISPFLQSRVWRGPTSMGMQLTDSDTAYASSTWQQRNRT